MIIYREAISRHKELVTVLVPLVQIYQKGGASSKAFSDFVERMATVLEQMDYAPNEIRGIDRKSFIDIIREWMSVAATQDIFVIISVFQI
jgi:hypothetical protein